MRKGLTHFHYSHSDWAAGCTVSAPTLRERDKESIAFKTFCTDLPDTDLPDNESIAFKTFLHRHRLAKVGRISEWGAEGLL